MGVDCGNKPSGIIKCLKFLIFFFRGNICLVKRTAFSGVSWFYDFFFGSGQNFLFWKVHTIRHDFLTVRFMLVR